MTNNISDAWTFPVALMYDMVVRNEVVSDFNDVFETTLLEVKPGSRLLLPKLTLAYCTVLNPS